MLTFAISTEETESTFTTVEAAQGATQMLDDMNINYKITVNTPNDTGFGFSGMNAWSDISGFFNL